MFSKHFSNKYNKALLLGTWWWNDIVSTIIIALDLQKQGIQTDIAWVLSPWAIHYFDGQKEQPINRIQGEVRRFINSRSLKEISFVDWFLPAIAAKHGVNIANYYDLSTRFWTKKLSDELNKLIAQNQYDLLLDVDVGWDILARSKEDDTLLSPIMDFTSLNLLKTLNIDNYLIEFGLLTDGELRAQWVKQILEELNEKWLLLDQWNISLEDDNIQTFIKIFDEIKKIRAWHTWVITLQTLQKIWSYLDLITQYRFRSQIWKKIWHTSFDVNIPHEYFGKTYLIDWKKFALDRSETAFDYQNTLDQYIRLKSMQKNRKTEMDLFYLRSWDNRTTPNKQWCCMHFLIPSTMIASPDRADMIQTWIDQLLSWETDLALISRDDLVLIPHHDGIKIQEAWNFCLVYQKDIQDFIDSTAQKIKEYQIL